MTYDDLTTLTLRDWLLPPDRQPTQVFLDAALDDASQTVSYDASNLAAEEQAALAPGVTVEIGYELMFVDAVDSTNGNLTVRRGWLGSDKAAHAVDDPVLISPAYPRQRIFNALQGIVSELSPPLVQMDTEYVGGLNPAPLPEGATGVVDAVTDFGEPVPAKFLRYLPGYDSPGVKIGGPYSGVTVVWRGTLVPPTKPGDKLADSGIPDAWGSLLALGAVARIFAASDIDNAVADHVFDRMASEGFPTGSAVQLARTLDRMFHQRVEQLRESQRQAMPMRKTFNGWINR